MLTFHHKPIHNTYICKVLASIEIDYSFCTLLQNGKCLGHFDLKVYYAVAKAVFLLSAVPLEKQVRTYIRMYIICMCTQECTLVPFVYFTEPLVLVLRFFCMDYLPVHVCPG